MKKVSLILMCLSISTMMVAESKPRTENVQNKGQPEYKASYNVYVPTAFVTEPIVVAYLENAYTVTTPYKTISATVESVPGVVKGTRKVRDVDLCSNGKYTIQDTQNRNAVNSKITRLPRGNIRCGSLYTNSNSDKRDDVNTKIATRLPRGIIRSDSLS